METGPRTPTLLWFAGIPARLFAALLAGTVAGCTVLALSVGYRTARILSFFSVAPDSSRESYQTTQALYALADGASSAGDSGGAAPTGRSQLLLAYGYVNTTVRGIAEAAGVVPATVYQAFGTKHGLLAATLDITIAGDDEVMRDAAAIDAAARELFHADHERRYCTQGVWLTSCSSAVRSTPGSTGTAPWTRSHSIDIT